MHIDLRKNLSKCHTMSREQFHARYTALLAGISHHPNCSRMRSGASGGVCSARRCCIMSRTACLDGWVVCVVDCVVVWLMMVSCGVTVGLRHSDMVRRCRAATCVEYRHFGGAVAALMRLLLLATGNDRFISQNL